MLALQENCWGGCCFEIFGKISSSDALTWTMTDGLGAVGSSALEFGAPGPKGTPALWSGAQARRRLFPRRPRPW